MCALVGAETANRRWVRYEIQRGVWEAKGLLAVRIHMIKDFNQNTTASGVNPFDVLGVYVEDKRMKLIARSSTSEKWYYSSDFVNVIPKWPYGSGLPPAGTHALSKFFPIYNWSSDAHKNIGSWIESAAFKASR
jgi:hypothetical protein